MARASLGPLSSTAQFSFNLATYNRAPQYLVVDDCPVTANAITIILNQNGYSCFPPAHNGEEAIEKARQFRPKFIVMNVVMPRMNGIDAAIRILREQPECRIVLTSGSRGASDMANEARAQGYDLPLLTKPFHPAELLRGAC